MTNLFTTLSFDQIATELQAMPPVEQMSKAQARRMQQLLHGDRPSRWLAGLRRSVETTAREGIDGESVSQRDAEVYTAMSLRSGATRRRVMHDDHGSADQMEFAADLLEVFGVKGLTF